MALILPQQEADALLALEKHFIDDKPLTFPAFGGTLRFLLHSTDRREEFNLDVTRGRISLTKITYQTRARKSVILVRLDIDGPPHRNPDDEEIPCPHLHVYREGFGEKWAIPMPDAFIGIDNPLDLLDAFMDFCNVVGKPMIHPELFP